MLLWFGSFKNGISTYAPSWVKLDPDRFPVQMRAEAKAPVLSVFAESNWRADARAFAQLMAHLRENDAGRSVLMVQVENEVGTLGDSRDRSAMAEAAWNSPVPERLIGQVRENPERYAGGTLVPADARPGASWPNVFGEGTSADEIFMAYHYASYLEQVARAGRREYDVPLFVNAWLNGEAVAGASSLAGGQRPGVYPSGGPLPHVASAWHTAAPSIDFLCPDFYHGDPDHWFSRYRDVSGLLFVPEMRRSPAGVAVIYLAIGAYGAFGTSPFGIDSISDDEAATLTRAYRQLGSIDADILCAQREGRIRGFIAQPGGPSPTFELNGYTLQVRPDFRSDPSVPMATGYGLVIAVGEREFLAAGRGFIVEASQESGRAANILFARELALPPVGSPGAGSFTGLDVLRHLNGDETLGGTAIRVTGDIVSAFGEIPSAESETGIIHFALY